MTDFGLASHLFNFFFLFITLHRRFHIIEQFVDDLVEADFHVLLFRLLTNSSIGADIEAKNQSMGGGSKKDVVIANGTGVSH